MSSDPILVNNAEVTAPLGSSYHNIVSFDITDWGKRTWKELHYDYINA